MPEFSELIAGLLDIQDERLEPLQDALVRAIREDIPIDRALGVRGSPRAAFWLSLRNQAMREGAFQCAGVGKFVELYGIWRAGGRLMASDDVLGLFEELDKCERAGFGLPTSKASLHRITSG